MTEIGHAFFRLYDCGLWLTIVIKSLKKPSISVRRYMKSWGLWKISKKIFLEKFNSNLSEMPRNSIKNLDPPFTPPLKNFENIKRIGLSVSDWKRLTEIHGRNFGQSPVTGHRSTTLKKPSRLCQNHKGSICMKINNQKFVSGFELRKSWH